MKQKQQRHSSVGLVLWNLHWCFRLRINSITCLTQLHLASLCSTFYRLYIIIENKLSWRNPISTKKICQVTDNCVWKIRCKLMTFPCCKGISFDRLAESKMFTYLNFKKTTRREVKLFVAGCCWHYKKTKDWGQCECLANSCCFSGSWECVEIVHVHRFASAAF